MKNNLIWALVLFFVQPILYIGMLNAFINNKKRINYSRKEFRVNFVRQNFELRDFLFKGILSGIITSIFIFAIGSPIIIEWYIVYQLLTMLLLIFLGNRVIHPVFTFPLATFLLYGLKYLNKMYYFIPIMKRLNGNIFDLSIVDHNISSLSVNLLFILSLILFTTMFFMKNLNENKNYPILKATSRGKYVAFYQNRFIWLLPLFVIVPGKVIKPFASWWLLLSVDGKEFAFLILPFLVGLHYKVSTQVLREATLQMKKDFQKVGLLALMFSIIGYFYPQYGLLLLALIFVVALLVLYRHYYREKNWSFKYGPVNEGLRIIAVRPDSPAERMGLKIGDIILDMNNQKLKTQADFYETIAYNRSYIHMRIERQDGAIIVVENPLYDDDYNNLGLLILES